jgi:DNA topoisomerase VI subunit B
MQKQHKTKDERVQFKSPAEFFAENQNIAGFDNAGKALYTTIRELVENSLDAAESAARLPEISLTIEEMDTPTFNKLRGIDTKKRVDRDLYSKSREVKGEDENDGGLDDIAASQAVSEAGGDNSKKAKKAKPTDPSTAREDTMYYRLTCKDNGCGLPHEKIPDMLGRVLSGSKYGVRQTRGKFGLGAKMALIWSKKSTGLPIEVKTAHLSSGVKSVGGNAAGASSEAESMATRIASHVSYCKLDIDIHKNEPNILEYTQTPNSEDWIGTQMQVVISGMWSSYRAKVMQYFQQLAVITPYAQFRLKYANISEKSAHKNDSEFVWRRRSNLIPKPPQEIKHHPSSVNDLLIQSLIDQAKNKSANMNLGTFMQQSFSNIDKSLATRLIAELGDPFSFDMRISELDAKRVHQISSLFTQAAFDPPSGTCLSPAGEYNLRLGVLKELRPELVATATAPVSVFEGHPFIVEAAVALGGRGNEGLAIHRFANRIPLLFEAGGDVATKTATRVAWNTYKIDPVKDKVAVFVSLVSTKVPFKGTGKEYIGDDAEEIRQSVKIAIQACCSQLRVKLLRAHALRARANRRKSLVKYIPDVCRALLGAFKAFSARQKERGGNIGLPTNSSDLQATHSKLLSDFSGGKLNEQLIANGLHTAVEKADFDAALEQASTISAAGGLSASAAENGDGTGGDPVFIAPSFQAVWNESYTLYNPDFVFKVLPSALVTPGSQLAEALN